MTIEPNIPILVNETNRCPEIQFHIGCNLVLYHVDLKIDYYISLENIKTQTLGGLGKVS
ncbi:MAG: hypothetical protein ACXACY_16600 [Candidatus Hodarchaeales archaeon]|jgi:hypothetical protein